MNFTKIRSTYFCELKILSPVHVGSGEKYVSNFDFLQDGTRIKVFDHKRLFTMVEKLGGSHIESFAVALEEGMLSRWLRENGINVNDAIVHSFSLGEQNDPKEISRQLRDGFGRPIIPGSSLKGVFRTAVISHLVRNDKTNQLKDTIEELRRREKVKVKYADSRLCNELLGQDAKMNLMRSLTVSDFTFSPGDVQVQSAYITRLTNKNIMSRKKWSIHLEKIKQSSTAAGQVSFDDFLTNQAKGKASFNFKADLTLSWLMQALRERTRKSLNHELSFLDEKSGDGVDALKRFYVKLEQYQQNLQEDEVIVQFGWGSGWKGMTGELIDQESLDQELRIKLNLAPKYLDFPFPKSRRVAGTGSEEMPMGWILLKFTSKEERRQAEAIRDQERKRELQIQAESENQRKMEQEAWEKMSEAERLSSSIRKEEATENDIVVIYNRIAEFRPEDQQIIAGALKQWWKAAGKWTKKECSKKQWEKVQKIKTILGES